MASVPGGIVPCADFYTYEAKYVDDSELQIPAHIPAETQAEVRNMAVKIFTALGCKGLARVDFFVTRNGARVLLNEVNSLPGFTKISMYPKMMINMGVSYEELIDKLFTLAMENFNDKSEIEY